MMEKIDIYYAFLDTLNIVLLYGCVFYGIKKLHDAIK